MRSTCADSGYGDVARHFRDRARTKKIGNGSRSTPAMTVSGSLMKGSQLRRRDHWP